MLLPKEACLHLICRIQREACAQLGLRPDLKGAETAAILQEAGLLVREPDPLARAELPVAAALNIREVDKAVTGHIRRDDHAPAFVSIETPDHAGHAALRGRVLLCHPPIVSPSAPMLSTSSAAVRLCLVRK